MNQVSVLQISEILQYLYKGGIWKEEKIGKQDKEKEKREQA